MVFVFLWLKLFYMDILHSTFRILCFWKWRSSAVIFNFSRNEKKNEHKNSKCSRWGKAEFFVPHRLPQWVFIRMLKIHKLWASQKHNKQSWTREKLKHKSKYKRGCANFEHWHKRERGGETARCMFGWGLKRGRREGNRTHSITYMERIATTQEDRTPFCSHLRASCFLVARLACLHFPLWLWEFRYCTVNIGENLIWQ